MQVDGAGNMPRGVGGGRARVDHDDVRPAAPRGARGPRDCRGTELVELSVEEAFAELWPRPRVLGDRPRTPGVAHMG